MPVIRKKSNLFRENYFKVFGTTWVLFGGAVVLVDDNMLLGYLYLLMGICYFILGYIKRDQKKAFIQWDPEKLVFSDWYQKPVEYQFSSIDALLISNQTLIIKSGAAKGTMVDLKGYREEDVKLLQTVFRDYQKTYIGQPA